MLTCYKPNTSIIHPRVIFWSSHGCWRLGCCWNIFRWSSCWSLYCSCTWHWIRRWWAWVWNNISKNLNIITMIQSIVSKLCCYYHWTQHFTPPRKNNSKTHQKTIKIRENENSCSSWFWKLRLKIKCEIQILQKTNHFNVYLLWI